RDALRDGRLRIREVAAVVVDDAVRGALGGPAALALAAVLRVARAADLGGVLTRAAAAADRDHPHETDHHRKKNVLHRRTLCLRRRPSCAVETSLRVRSPAGPGGPRQRARGGGRGAPAGGPLLERRELLRRSRRFEGAAVWARWLLP